MTIQQIKKDIAEGQQMLFTKDDVLRIIEEVAAELSTHNESDPIPLTEEILNKNGIYYDEITEEWSKNGIVLYKYNNDSRWWLSGYYDIIVIKYVHELQSFLKLAGIKDNLKI